MVDRPYPSIERDAYPLFLKTIEKTFPDARKVWPDKYEQWLALYDVQMKTDQGHGENIVPIPIDPDEFVKHCRDHGRDGGEMAMQRFVETLIAQPGPRVNDDYDPFKMDD